MERAVFSASASVQICFRRSEARSLHIQVLLPDEATKCRCHENSHREVVHVLMARRCWVLNDGFKCWLNIADQAIAKEVFMTRQPNGAVCIK